MTMLLLMEGTTKTTVPLKNGITWTTSTSRPVSIARTAVFDPEFGVGPLRFGVKEFEV